jgi:hypothetical protein
MDLSLPADREAIIVEYSTHSITALSINGGHEDL